MSCQNIHENDVGTEFIVTFVECDSTGAEVPVDISNATSKQIKFMRSDDTTFVVSASFTLPASGGVGDGTDGKISYFTQAGDLTPPGAYRLQGIVTLSSGTWYSSIESFYVNENL